MATADNADGGPIKTFPADDLRHARRYVTSHNKAGQGVFIADDDGAHHRVMVHGKAVANVIYSTVSNPVDLNDENDVAWARDNEQSKNASSEQSAQDDELTALQQQPSIHVSNGSVARLIDFAPGVESPFHRAMSIDFGVAIEGKFELTLDSGDKKIMLPGDTSVNRGTMHKWRNCDDEHSGRMVFVLLDVAPLTIGGQAIGEDLGDLASEYAHLKGN